MPGTTGNLSLPYPLATEAVELGATDFQNLADALDAGGSGPTASLVKKGTLATIPAQPQPLGTRYICTDVKCTFISDGAAWHYQALDSSGPPPGSIMQYGGSTDPVDPDGQTRWLICDGRAISRTTYPACYANIATTYGAGDGSTTFNIPDGRQRFLLGKATSGTGNTLGHAGGSIDHQHTLTQAGAKIGVPEGGSNDLLIGFWGNVGTFNAQNRYTIGSSLEPGDSINGEAVDLIGQTDTGNGPYLVINHIIRAL